MTILPKAMKDVPRLNRLAIVTARPSISAENEPDSENRPGTSP
jgi:hypothetical protein